jgi:hypothetical protein
MNYCWLQGHHKALHWLLGAALRLAGETYQPFRMHDWVVQVLVLSQAAPPEGQALLFRPTVQVGLHLALEADMLEKSGQHTESCERFLPQSCL